MADDHTVMSDNNNNSDDIYTRMHNLSLIQTKEKVQISRKESKDHMKFATSSAALGYCQSGDDCAGIRLAHKPLQTYSESGYCIFCIERQMVIDFYYNKKYL